MIRISTTARIALSLALLSANALLVAQLVGLLPDHRKVAMQGRVSLCEALAINCSCLAIQEDVSMITENLSAVVFRNDEVLSAAVRHRDGRLLAKVGEHDTYWRGDRKSSATGANIYVPIIKGTEPWGTVELSFEPLVHASFFGIVISPFFRLVVFVTAFDALVFIFFLGKVLKQLDPSKVVPTRVRSALDTLAEGLLVLDKKGRIMMANSAFANTVGEAPETLQGRAVSDFAWERPDGNGDSSLTATFTAHKERVGIPISLGSGDSQRTFMVNTMPIRDDKGHHRGILASFDDVTILENKKAELVEMLKVLEQSRDKIRLQNEQLQLLATRDPMTSCLNRRSFFEQFDTHWSAAGRYGHPLCCIMTDVDHFKSVNDNFGHSRGDEVLIQVADALREASRDSDLVCRYGGEEFCVLLPHTDIEEGHEAAERFRKIIAQLEFPDLKVTVSLGVSSIAQGATDPQDMLNQADKCLYVAKRNGRNQTVRWDMVSDDMKTECAEAPTTAPPEQEDSEANAIPFHAVTALLSALAYRDEDTASHSARVADLCVSAARGMMSVREAYVLEVAGLLHDIGKIGVPDAILLKPGPLSDEEWEIMRLHDRIGVEIVAASFACPELVAMIQGHHFKFGGDPERSQLPRGEEIPVGARLLTISDAFDAMISDRVYRKGRSMDAAFAELRRCAGSQFDPELVEHFIQVIGDQPEPEHTTVETGSKQAALQIGLQIERLAEAVDMRDIPSLVALASHLETTSAKIGNSKIEKLAAELKELASEEPDLFGLIETTLELIDLCWAMQRAYINPKIKGNGIQEARNMAHVTMAPVTS